MIGVASLNTTLRRHQSMGTGIGGSNTMTDTAFPQCPCITLECDILQIIPLNPTWD